MRKSCRYIDGLPWQIKVEKNTTGDLSFYLSSDSSNDMNPEWWSEAEVSLCRWFRIIYVRWQCASNRRRTTWSTSSVLTTNVSKPVRWIAGAIRRSWPSIRSWIPQIRTALTILSHSTPPSKSSTRPASSWLYGKLQTFLFFRWDPELHTGANCFANSTKSFWTIATANDGNPCPVLAAECAYFIAKDPKAGYYFGTDRQFEWIKENYPALVFELACFRCQTSTVGLVCYFAMIWAIMLHILLLIDFSK